MLVRLTRTEVEATKRLLETIDPEVKMQLKNAIEGPLKINFDGSLTIKIDPDYIIENLELVTKYIPVIKAICQQVEAVGRDIISDTERINKKYYPQQRSSYNQELDKTKREIERIEREVHQEIERFNKKFNNYKEVE